LLQVLQYKQFYSKADQEEPYISTWRHGYINKYP
jgi:hypothetical protein